MEETSATRMPVGFVGHGSPGTVLDDLKRRVWGAWGRGLPRPTAVLVVSAHWEDSPLRLGRTSGHDRLYYDFGGFPEPLYRLTYPAPGAPELAGQVIAALPEGWRPLATDRPLDHGAWMPLLHMFPAADLPVLQLSMPDDLSDGELYDLGRHLAPLRRQGVFILGSGNVVHNIMRPRPPETPDYARRFDAWVAEALLSGDQQKLLEWRRHPDARHSHPSDEHFRPLLVAVGAAGGDTVSFPMEGFEHITVSLRSVQFG